LINVVTGFGPTTGAPLIQHQDVRMISFTGGTKGGSAASLSASKNVKPIIMELGGKSPQIIFKDADLTLSVNGVVSGIFPVSGHSCISGSRILVHKDIKDKFTHYF
jgi:acyl-CoA reductase-like NAD-dependent aldehyde dehydrogenase